MRRKLFIALAVLAGAGGIIGLAVYDAVRDVEVELPAEESRGNPGDLVSVTRTVRLPAFALRAIVKAADLPERIDVDHGATLYRVLYLTTQYDGRVVEASALVAFPHGGASDRLVVYQHGTTTSRRGVPSEPGSQEGLPVAIGTAGQGFALCAPDYVGLGESRELHPYLYQPTTVETALDLIRATRTLGEHLKGSAPSRLFLTGFSQGGQATFSLLRKLELEPEEDLPVEVVAAAPVAGAFDLRNISLPQALTGETDSHELYLGYIVTAYARVYDLPISTALREPYATDLPRVFDGEHDVEQVFEALPELPREMFSDEFLKAYDESGDHWLLDAFEENSIEPWAAKAPIRAYYGDADVDVLPAEALRAESTMSALGADISAISVGPYGHDESALHALPRAFAWFREIEEQKGT